MTADLLANATATVPPGAYAIGVSGGADSVALLHVLNHCRRDLRLHVVHLDHETRGAASAGDAEFVRNLAERFGLPCTIARRSEVERRMSAVPANPSARFRAARHHLFREVIAANGLLGVILAHHADDQAETVMHRLLRGAHAPYLTGMSQSSRVNGMAILRPLLEVPPDALRAYLASAGQGWREDASNASDAYLRNRLRQVIAPHEPLREALLGMHASMHALREWVRSAAPRLEDAFGVRLLQGQPTILAAQAVRRWLRKQGVPADEVLPGTVTRVVEMATDAATPSRQSLPGGLTLSRSRGRIHIVR